MGSFDSNDDLLEMFVLDTEKTLENIETLLLEAEDNGYTEKIVGEIFRGMHSMKGSAATMGYENMTQLSHAMEDIFDEIRKNGTDNIDSSWLTSMLLICKDFLIEELGKVSKKRFPDGDVTELVSEIRKQIGFMKHYEELPNNTINENFPDEGEAIEKIKIPAEGNFKTYYAKIFFAKDSGMPNVRALILVQRIGECMLIREHIPYELTNEKSEDTIIRRGFQIMFDTELEMEDVKKFIENNALCLERFEVSLVLSDDSLKKEEKNSEKSAKEEVVQKSATPEAKLNKGQISVGVAKLDKLMDITSEIIISQALLILEFGK